VKKTKNPSCACANSNFFFIEFAQVHFKSGVGSDAGIGNQVSALQVRLDEFHSEVKSICSRLETSLAEIDKLQEVKRSVRNFTNQKRNCKVLLTEI